jgi:hypothetical protein
MEHTKKDILKGAGVLLITAIMIISATAVMANTTTYPTSKNPNQCTSVAQEIKADPKTQTKTDIINEGFEGTTFPPAGWTRVQTNTGVCDAYPQYYAYWYRFTESSHSGSASAAVWWDYQHQDEWLITPSINLAGYTSAQVVFWTYGYIGSTYDDHYYVKVSTDGGSTWTILMDLSTMSPEGWNEWATSLTVNLANYLGQTIKIAFHALDPPSNDGLWYCWQIDDVVVSGESGGADLVPPVTSCSLAGTMEGDVYVTDVTATLTATDDNSGVDYTMFKVDGGVFAEYSDPIVVTGNGEHTVYYYSVDVAGNIEEEKSTTFTIQYPAVIEITIKGGIGVSASLKNNGTEDLTNVSWEISLEGGLILLGKTKTGTVDIPAGEAVTVKDFVFGIGKPTITVTADTVEANATATVILFFVLNVA